MADRVVLHIGSMKSGTSFIQNVLGNNREALAEHGIAFAGERWRDQVSAVQDLIAHGGPRQEPLDPAVNPEMEWYPVTTFLNLAVDMAVSTAFEHDQGHKYGTQPLLAWAAMLQPAGWSPDRVTELRAALAGTGP